MHSDQQPYRDLYDAILDYDGSALYADVVRPWLRDQDEERRWLAAFAQRRGSPIPEASIEDLWRLYALSRIIDLLQLSFVPYPTPKTGWHIAPVSASEYGAFMSSLGLERITQTAFHPFVHEIVSVEPAGDVDPPITIIKEYWPAYMLGPLLMTRAGCAVHTGARHLDKSIAESTTLYWAFARNHRPRSDLSVGWGSNSQWRTAFRRDYRIDGVLHYNVDADPARVDLDDGLTADEMLELLRYRSFVLCTKPHEERFPFHYSHREEL